MPLSSQQSSGSSKAAKFVAANPLGPMANPFEGLNDDQKEYYQTVSDNINERLAKTLEDIKDEHDRGVNKLDNPEFAPTGQPYKAAAAEQRQKQLLQKKKEEEERKREVEETKQLKDVARHIFQNNNNEDNNNDNDDEEEDDEYDDLLNEEEDDEELDAIRQRRIAELKKAQIQKAQDLSNGHGQYRTITQDEFLPECTGSSKFVTVHFFHRDFRRCDIMDFHLKIIAPLHTSCKFLRIDAEKAPFFISKLGVRTLPTVLVFENGALKHRLTGFDGLTTTPTSSSSDGKDVDQWHTSRLQQWLASTGAIEYKMPTEDLMEEMKRLGLQPRGAVWSESSRLEEDHDEYYYDDDHE